MRYYLTLLFILLLSTHSHAQTCTPINLTCVCQTITTCTPTPTLAPTPTSTPTATVTPTPTPTSLLLVALGDSKTVGDRCCAVSKHGYRDELATFAGATWVGVNAQSGWYAINLKLNIDAWLSGITQVPDFALINIGTNDLWAHTAEVDYKDRISYTVDAIHTHWPTTQVRLATPWRRTQDADAETMATWLADITSTRSSWCMLGYNERVYLKGNDDGWLYTGSDGEHANELGYTVAAKQWCWIVNPAGNCN